MQVVVVVVVEESPFFRFIKLLTLFHISQSPILNPGGATRTYACGLKATSLDLMNPSP